jgi:hypothetical protein
MGRWLKMSKTYVVSVDSMRAINADSEEEALIDAKSEFIEMLQRDEAELIVVEEIEGERDTGYN